MSMGNLLSELLKQAAEDKSFGSVIIHVKTLSNNVSRPTQVPLPANGKAPLFPQSNPLYYVNLSVSFLWFWPSSSIDNP